jgi:hypothetical protein
MEFIHALFKSNVVEILYIFLYIDRWTSIMFSLNVFQAKNGYTVVLCFLIGDSGIFSPWNRRCSS